MRVVGQGNTFKIYDNSMKTYEALPARCYSVKFNPREGFSLEQISDIRVSDKVYGIHGDKVEKVMSTFKRISNRNLGVILSGDKGIGKSLCAKMLAQEATIKGYPLIVVSSYAPGIADYLASIDQEVVILFDEFDKTFSISGSSNDMNDPQSEMLTLFDGLSQGKKLFVITCNNLRGLNDYLINRPGRFHYHFRFEYPSSIEIRAYMEDKLNPMYYGEIDKVIDFSRKVNLNYDCLRSIAFELSTGLSFGDAIQDLNILKIEEEKYSISVIFSDGSRVNTTAYLDMFEDEDRKIELSDHDGYDFYITFNPCQSFYDYTKGGTIIKSEDVGIDWEDDYYGDSEEAKAKLAIRKARKVSHIVIRRKESKKLHYMV